MKRIGTLNGKAVVIGDSNSVTKNQILYNKEKNGSISLSERDNSGGLKPITGGGGGDSSLSKGKKILSEYYYIDYFKLFTEGTEEDKDYLNVILLFMAHDNFVEDENFGAPTEVGDIIFKVKYDDNECIYMYDKLFVLGSGMPETAALAIRKYCKINTPAYVISERHVNDFVPVFLGTALAFASEGSENPSVEELLPYVNEMYQAFVSALSPYLISEEEFWNEANIIEDAETILNDWLSE